MTAKSCTPMQQHFQQTCCCMWILQAQRCFWKGVGPHVDVGSLRNPYRAMEVVTLWEGWPFKHKQKLADLAAGVNSCCCHSEDEHHVIFLTDLG